MGVKISRGIQYDKFHPIYLRSAVKLLKIRLKIPFAVNYITERLIARRRAGFTVGPDRFHVEILGNVNQTIEVVAIGMGVD